MKHTQRRSIGLELFFSTRSGTFSGLNECSASDVEHLAGDVFFTRLSAAGEIRSALREYHQANCPLELLPDDIQELADASLLQCSQPENITRFFEWLIDIARQNESDRIMRTSSLNAVAAHFDGAAASFIRTGFALNNQRVMILRNNDTLSMSCAERDWGRVRVSFGDCIYDESFTSLYLPGYAFSVEAEPEDDGYRFRMLIDTRFAENDYCERLMQPEGWHEISFFCRTIDVQPTLCDYAGRLNRLGTPRAEIIDKTCSSLLSKYSILGSGGLSSSEQAMLPVAEFLTGCAGLLTHKKDQTWRDEQIILDALDNRYAMQQFGSMLKNSRCDELSRRFEQCTMARYEDDEQLAIRSTRIFAGLYELHIADGKSRSLIMELSDRLLAMTSEFTDSSHRIDAETDIISRLESVIEPTLKDLEFTGYYPHYSRHSPSGKDYLSLMILPAYDAPKHGVYSYYISLSAAKHDLSEIDRIKSSGIDVNRINALDCQPELSSVSQYGELAASDDGIVITMESAAFKSHPAVKDESSRLPEMLALADFQFKNGKLPANYAFRRLLHFAHPSYFMWLLVTSFPLCAVISLLLLVCYLLLTEPLTLPMLTPLQAFGGTALICALTSLISAIIRRIYYAGHLWRFK